MMRDLGSDEAERLLRRAADVLDRSAGLDPATWAAVRPEGDVAPERERARRLAAALRTLAAAPPIDRAARAGRVLDPLDLEAMQAAVEAYERVGESAAATDVADLRHAIALLREG